jgi:hypothetical protein
MKTLLKIIWRLVKVTYVLLLLIGPILIFYVWSNTAPYPYTTYSYKVTCNNGKVFDPTSKPIATKFVGYEPLLFNVNELKSECEYGTAYYVGWSSKLADNYVLAKVSEQHFTGTRTDQVKITTIVFFLYYLILEILRRTFLYIFLGKNFISLKNKVVLNKKTNKP